MELLSEELHTKSRFSEPVYYVFDNRANVSPFPLWKGVRGLG